MYLRKLPKQVELIDIALGRARKEAGGMPKQKIRRKAEKSAEIKRIEVAANYVHKALDSVVKDFPSMEELPAFQREIIGALVDVNSLKQSLGQFSAASKIVRNLKARHIVQIKKQGRSNEGKPKEVSRAFIGRLASLVKSLRKSIEIYNTAAEKLREMPAIKELPTVIIAGFPNVGKSTLLRKITGSKVKVAAYPFTTQRLELGYFKEKYMKIQVVDTPGLLDRPLEERNAIEKKGVAALKHLASLIVFVVDATEKCGFSLEKQLGLLHGIAKEFGNEKIVVYLSKQDIASKSEIERAGETLKEFEVLDDGIAEMRSVLASKVSF